MTGQDPFRREYRVLSGEEQAHVAKVKRLASDLYTEIKAFGPNREQSLAITALEEAVMWAVKARTG